MGYNDGTRPVRLAIRRKLPAEYREVEFYQPKPNAGRLVRFLWSRLLPYLHQYQETIETYLYDPSTKTEPAEAFREAAEQLLDGDWPFHPKDFLFLCGPEFFDRALAAKGVQEMMMFPAPRMSIAVQGRTTQPVAVHRFGFDIHVIPWMDGWTIVPKSILQA